MTARDLLLCTAAAAKTAPRETLCYCVWVFPTPLLDAAGCHAHTSCCCCCRCVSPTPHTPPSIHATTPRTSFSAVLSRLVHVLKSSEFCAAAHSSLSLVTSGFSGGGAAASAGGMTTTTAARQHEVGWDRAAGCGQQLIRRTAAAPHPADQASLLTWRCLCLCWSGSICSMCCAVGHLCIMILLRVWCLYAGSLLRISDTNRRVHRQISVCCC